MLRDVPYHVDDRLEPEDHERRTQGPTPHQPEGADDHKLLNENKVTGAAIS